MISRCDSAHTPTLSGPKNGNWKGGRSVASNGYVLIRVGKDHHLADVRGYAYEHRVVAEQKIGRRLLPGEQVHHENGIKTDNRPENLTVVAGTAEHRVLHRGKDSGLRMPGEENPDVECRCGCGETFPKFDECGRPRQFVSGHNPPPSPATDAILCVLDRVGVATNAQIASATGAKRSTVRVTLSKLKQRGVVVNPSRGVWARKAQ